MDWFTQILAFGFLAFFMFVFSAVFALIKKTIIGLFFGLLELFSASISSLAWMEALRVSGKTDWFLLGLFGYTPVALIFYSMFIVGIGCVVINLWLNYKQRTTKSPATQV